MHFWQDYSSTHFFFCNICALMKGWRGLSNSCARMFHNSYSLYEFITIGHHGNTVALEANGKNMLLLLYEYDLHSLCRLFHYERKKVWLDSLETSGSLINFDSCCLLLKASCEIRTCESSSVFPPVLQWNHIAKMLRRNALASNLSGRLASISSKFFLSTW